MKRILAIILSAGILLTATACGSGGDNGNDGTESEYITTPETTDTTPTTTVTTTTPQTTTTEPETEDEPDIELLAMYVTANTARVRAGASFDDEILSILNHRDSVEVIGEAEDGWLIIKWEGETAYMHSDVLSETRPAAPTQQTGTPNNNNRPPQATQPPAARPPSSPPPATQPPRTNPPRPPATQPPRIPNTISISGGGVTLNNVPAGIAANGNHFTGMTPAGRMTITGLRNTINISYPPSHIDFFDIIDLYLGMNFTLSGLQNPSPPENISLWDSTSGALNFVCSNTNRSILVSFRIYNRNNRNIIMFVEHTGSGDSGWNEITIS